MESPSLLRLAAVFFAGLFTLQAARPFLCCDYNGGKVCAVSAEGKIEWKRRGDKEAELVPIAETVAKVEEAVKAALAAGATRA